MHNSEFTYSIVELNNNEWSSILAQFDDATIYQTNSFAKYSIGGEKRSQFILKKNNEIVAVALLRIKTVPVLNRGIAYLRWGPIWQKRDKPIDINNFRMALELLYEEFVKKRKLVLRISSNVFLENEFDFTNIFNKSNFKLFAQPDKTMILDLTQDEETLRKNLRKQWRYMLRQAEKEELTVVSGTDEYLFDEFIKIYKEMHQRKNFNEYVNIEDFKKINADLCKENKMNIFICKKDKTVLSAMVTTAFGNSGIYLLGGSTNEGLKMSSSYLLQWETIQWLKSLGKKWYDLGGIDATAVPGVYKFKTGMRGKEVTFIGGFEANENLISKKIIQLGELIKKVKSKK